MTRTVHKTENGLFRVDVVQDGEDSPLNRTYIVVNNDYDVAEYTGTVLTNVLALAELFDARYARFKETGSIKEDDDPLMMDGPPPTARH